MPTRSGWLRLEVLALHSWRPKLQWTPGADVFDLESFLVAGDAILEVPALDRSGNGDVLNATICVAVGNAGRLLGSMSRLTMLLMDLSVTPGDDEVVRAVSDKWQPDLLVVDPPSVFVVSH